MTLFLNLLSCVSYAGGTGGGGVLRKETQIARPVVIDFIKNMNLDSSGKVQFKFKPFDSDKIELHDIDLKDINEIYAEALKKSQLSGKWEPVVIGN